MNRIKLRLVACIAAALCCTAACSPAALAYSDDPGLEPSSYEEEFYEEEIIVEEESIPDETIPSEEAWQEPVETPDATNVPTDAEPVSTAAEVPFTPDGNLTMVDDFSTEYNGVEVEGKQFITLQSKSGNTFFLVIDRDCDADNVYFMNLVDEADLMSLIETDDSSDSATCTCSDRCAYGSIETSCEVCRVDMGACKGTEPVTAAPEITEEPAEAAPASEEATNAKPNSNTLLLLLLVLAAAGGGAVYYLKFRKSGANTKGSSDLDDYFNDDDDEYAESMSDDQGDDLDDMEYLSEEDE